MSRRTPRHVIAIVAILVVLCAPACKKKKAPAPKKPAAASAARAQSAPSTKVARGKAVSRTPSLAPAEPDRVSKACAAYDKRIADSSRPYLEAFSNMALACSQLPCCRAARPSCIVTRYCSLLACS